MRYFNTNKCNQSIFILLFIAIRVILISMILAFDIGNTNTHLGFYLNSGLAGQKAGWIAIETISNSSLNNDFLTKVLKINGGKKIVSAIKTILVSSTNPAIEVIIYKWSKKVFKIKPLKAGEDFPIPIINRTAEPENVGKDRLLNAFAAYRSDAYERSVPNEASGRIVADSRRGEGKSFSYIIVISCGTAVTFDVVLNPPIFHPESIRGCKRGAGKPVFVGGLIAPGLNTMAKSLSQNCASLPLISPPKNHPPLIGKNTLSAIAAGVYFGFSGQVKCIVEELVRELRVGGTPHSKIKIILTGGDAEIVRPVIPFKNEIIPNLTLKGLVFSYLR
ncbi:MAG: type III pantothenate kinase [Planctomycetota bacterium]|nr:type III pantothenate kinase [Planctomycetota bacterium]MDI6787693.1 type III pantothenate kinase [Planctomycetota bacterium]